MKSIKKSLNKNRKSYGFAINGIRKASGGNNFRYQLIGALLVIILGIFSSLKPWEWVTIVIMIGLVLASETFNSAIESLVDLISPDHDPVAGKVKDMAAGAVLILAVTSIAVALIIFIPKFIHY